MVTRTYVPEDGDIVWLEFDPQAGHEKAGHCPALVLSPAAYNAKKRLDGVLSPVYPNQRLPL
ncbi:MAG: endoribonuclease MazF [Pseudomonadota bacterium]|jgi:mRNA interferase MazF